MSLRVQVSEDSFGKPMQARLGASTQASAGVRVLISSKGLFPPSGFVPDSRLWSSFWCSFDLAHTSTSAPASPSSEVPVLGRVREVGETLLL
jgi:hypothetical protein